MADTQEAGVEPAALEPDASDTPSNRLTAGGVIALLLIAIVALLVFFMNRPRVQPTTPENPNTVNANGTVDATAPSLNPQPSNQEPAALTP